jgi:hypothetical protein
MSLKDVDIGNALRRLAERRIEDAMKEGKFDNLSGAGQPLELEEPPAQEEARLVWWALRILRQNDVIPDEVRWRKEIDTLKAELDVVADEGKLAKLVAKINVLVQKLNTLGTNAKNIAMAPVSLEGERQRLRARRQASQFESPA